MPATKTSVRPPQDEWDTHAKRLIKGAMALHDYSYKSLARALEGVGEEITESALALRINRGTFSLAFAIKVLTVMGVESVDLGHIKKRR